MATNDLPPAAIAALERGAVIEAIKELRTARGIGLKEAKDEVDAYIRSQPALNMKITQLRAEGSSSLKKFMIIAFLFFLGMFFFFR